MSVRHRPRTASPDTLADFRRVGGRAPLSADIGLSAGRIGSRKKRLTCPTEHAEQVAVIEWADLMRSRWPELGLLFAVPNGAHKSMSTAMRFRREGLKKGVPDLVLPVARGGHHGLFLEMKRVRDSETSPEQKAWIAALKEQGYRAEVCRGAQAAIAVLLNYLTETR